GARSTAAAAVSASSAPSPRARTATDAALMCTLPLRPTSASAPRSTAVAHGDRATQPSVTAVRVKRPGRPGCVDLLGARRTTPGTPLNSTTTGGFTGKAVIVTLPSGILYVTELGRAVTGVASVRGGPITRAPTTPLPHTNN